MNCAFLLVILLKSVSVEKKSDIAILNTTYYYLILYKIYVRIAKNIRPVGVRGWDL